MNPQPLNGLISEAAADTISKRMTGRTVAEWEAEWRRRRYHGLMDRKLNGQALHTVEQRDTAARFYDLDAEADFDAVVAKVGTMPVDIPYDLRDLPVVVMPEALAEALAAAHAARATAACPGLQATILYRVRQSTLRRIAADRA